VELDDDFAREVGAETLDSLRERVREDLLAAGKEREKAEARRAALDQILSANPDLEVPESMVEDRLQGMLEEIAHSMAAQGIDPDQARVDWDEMRRNQLEPARRAVKASLLLDAIARQDDISLEPEELDAALEREARRRRQTASALRGKWEKDGRLEALTRQLIREKSLDFVLSAANI
jgi:trigger factor